VIEMWIKDTYGNLVNILNLISIIERGNFVEGISAYRDRLVPVLLYEGDNCEAYMTELEKELAAFGKLIRVEI